MRTLYLLNMNGNRYGVWKDDVASVRGVGAVHRIPLSPVCIAGISVLDGRSTALADLGVCIGLRPFDASRGGRVLLVQGKDDGPGFVVPTPPEEVDITPDAVQSLPDYVRTDEISTCVILEGTPVPVIELARLYDRLQGQAADPSRPALRLPPFPAVDAPPPADVRLVSAGGEIFAFPSDTMGDCAGRRSGMASVALAPRPLRGIIYSNNAVLPVVHLAEQLGLPRRGGGGLLINLVLSGTTFGLLVDEDAGTLTAAEAAIRPLPPVAATGWPRFAVLSRDGIIPLLDPWTLLGGADREDLLRKLPGQYSPSSRFGELFERQAVEVVEFSLLGVRHALPKNEVEDVVGFKPCRKLPGAIPIVIGVAEHGGEVLPVLDLALVFGRRSLEKPDWSMLLVRNGDFRALVITESVYGERTLPREVQRRVPIHLPHELVYGCYPEGIAVRLILNVEALAVHFDKSVVRDLLAALTTEMAAAPAELVPSLLPEEGVREETAAASLAEVAAEEQARRETEERRRTEEEAVQRTAEEEKARRADEAEQAKREEEERIRLEAEESARREGEEQARREAEERRRLEEEAAQRAAEEEKARRAAEEEQTRRESEERIRLESEERAAKDEEERAKQEAAEKARREAEESVRREGEERARREAEERRRLEEEAAQRAAEEEKARRAAEAEQAKREEDERRHLEAAERAAREAEERAKQEAAEKARREAEESARREAEEQARRQAEEYDRREAEERARRLAEEETARKAEEERRTAAAAAILEDERTRKEKERKLMQAAGITLADKSPPSPEAVPSPGEQPHLPDHTAWKKYVAIAAGLVLVSLIYFGAQVRSPEEKSWEGAGPVGERVEQKSENTGAKASQEPVLTKTKVVQEPVQSKKGALRDELLVLTVPSDRAIEADVYIVVKGDTLWAICKRFTGNPFNYPRVARDNSIANPDLIFPGQKIHLKK